MTVLCITSCDGSTGSRIANHLVNLPSNKFKQIRLLCEDKGECHHHLDTLAAKNFDLCEVKPTDKDGMRRAFQGVTLAVIIPPVRQAKWQVAQIMLESAQEANVTDAILLSWTGTHADVTDSDTVELHKFKNLEGLFMSSGKIQHKVIVRANFLVENLLTYSSTVIHSNILPLPMGTGKISPLDSDCLGEAVAKMCECPLDPKYRGQTLTFTGPKALSGEEMAREFASVFDKNVQYKDISIDEARATLNTTKPKLDDTEIQALVDMYKLIQRGIMDHTSDDLAKLGIKHPSFSESIRRLKTLFIQLAGSGQEPAEQQYVQSSA